MDDLLRELLVDPADHGLLELREGALVNPRTGRSYALSPEGIPNLLLDEAATPTQAIGSCREDVKKGKA